MYPSLELTTSMPSKVSVYRPRSLKPETAAATPNALRARLESAGTRDENTSHVAKMGAADGRPRR
jgi:hypothetical protein